MNRLGSVRVFGVGCDGEGGILKEENFTAEIVRKERDHKAMACLHVSVSSSFELDWYLLRRGGK